ncbi:MAG TPA: glucose-1-phosphate cytidylyltransferase [Methylomirabilota bacterium]|jgi:glucose-1-phosphate cytidylyltransferase|nr:glucose-1-phosphate cytidylyltransferase [Methylomirabilota bacterium]
MKVVILAGGLGSRLQEETTVRPKPMVEIGGKPILWHILNIYAAHGFQEFVVALGYKGEFIKDYFLNFYALNNDVTVDLASGEARIHRSGGPSWKVHLVDTGASTQTGGRLKRLAPLLGDGTFMLTYGDGVADVRVKDLVAFHRSHGKLATVTAVRPPSRFGSFLLDGNRIREFQEKPQTGEGWINGGFFVLEPGVLDLIEGDETYWERAPMEKLAADGQLMAYRHEGFWQAMDTLRERRVLDELWASGRPPWKVW